jgi:hypothetical protein
VSVPFVKSTTYAVPSGQSYFVTGRTKQIADTIGRTLATVMLKLPVDERIGTNVSNK